MVDFGNYRSIGDAWLESVRRILKEGELRTRTTPEKKEVCIEIKGCCVSIAANKRTDSILQEYAESEKIEWMEKNFTEIGRVEIGGMPILWHIMKEYSYYGI